MEIILTGGAGYIGAHIVNDLLENHHKVVVVDNFSTGFTQFLDERATVFKGSVENDLILESAFASLKSPDRAGVIHCAGLKHAGESVNRPIDFYISNTINTVNILKCMKKFGVLNLIFSSSSSVYGNSGSDNLVSENSALNPLSPYGKSKLFAEEIIEDFKKEFQLKSTCLRYFNVIGNGSIRACDTSKWNLMPNIYRAITSRSTFQIYGGNYSTPDGSCIRDYVDVISIARAHRQVLEKMAFTNDIPRAMNLGNQSGVSVLDMMRIVQENIDKNFNYTLVNGRVGDPASIISDCTLAQQFINWSPKSSVEEMVISGWEAYKREKALF